MTNNPEQALQHEYILADESAWVSAGKFSVYIKKTDEGVVVDIYALGRESEDALAGTYAFNNEIDDLDEEVES